jgi:LuxR family maltose regulon positive regulatory protein
VLDTPEAEALLERVEQANLFLVALDEDGEWFRYQSLFAEYARALLEPGAAAALHRRAAGWFRERGLIEEAVEQYAAAGEERAIAELIEMHHLTLARSGRAATIEHWIGALPVDLVTARPGLLTAGLLAAGGSALPRDEALRLLALADRAREADAAAWTPYHETTRLLLRALYGDDDVGQAVTCARSALAAAREDAHELEVVALSVLAFTMLLAGSDEADEVAHATIVHPGAPLSPYGHVGALATRALAAATDERPRVASTFAGRALEHAERDGIEASISAALAHFALALVALLDERPGDAERELRQALTIRPAIECGALHAWLTAAGARVAAARGRLAVAERQLAEARELLAGCADAGRAVAFADAAERHLREVRAGAATPLEPLSKAEVAVLRLFDQDRSARAIGAELYLSHNTVKTHIRAIYRKLGVGTREDALARGEALGLLKR